MNEFDKIQEKLNNAAYWMSTNLNKGLVDMSILCSDHKPFYIKMYGAWVHTCDNCPYQEKVPQLQALALEVEYRQMEKKPTMCVSCQKNPATHVSEIFMLFPLCEDCR